MSDSDSLERVDNEGDKAELKEMGSTAYDDPFMGDDTPYQKPGEEYNDYLARIERISKDTEYGRIKITDQHGVSRVYNSRPFGNKLRWAAVAFFLLCILAIAFWGT